MKDDVLILSKTKMNRNQVCVGGLTWGGRYVRLLDEHGENHPENTDLEPRQVWEIEFEERTKNIPPHVEDILMISRIRKDNLKDVIKDFIVKRDIPIWKGHPDQLFDRLIHWTDSGSGYIDKTGFIPKQSVGFWISDKDLIRKDYKGIRYQYPSTTGWRSLKYKGMEEPVDIIPAGTLIRVSLARWIAFDEGEQPKCWLQLSGWYDLMKVQ